MDPRRGHQPYSQFPTWHQSRYTNYPDDRQHPQYFRESDSFNHEDTIESRYYDDYRRDSIDPTYYHDDTIEPGYYPDDTIESRYYHEDTIEPRYYHDDTIESRYYHGDTIDPRYYHDDTIEPRYNHDDTIEPRYYHGDTIEPRYYHDDTIDPRYYHDDHRDLNYSEVYAETSRSHVNTSTDHNIYSHDTVGKTCYSGNTGLIRHPLNTIGNTGQIRHPLNTIGNTGQIRHPLNTTGNTGQVRHPLNTTGNTGKIRHPLNTTGNTGQVRHPLNTTGNTGQIRHPLNTIGNTGQIRHPLNTTGNTGQVRHPPNTTGSTGQIRHPLNTTRHPLNTTGNTGQIRHPLNSTGNNGQIRHPPNTTGNSGQIRHSLNTTGNTGQISYSNNNSVNDGENKYPKGQKSPLLLTPRATNVKQIPAVYGQGLYRSPEKLNSPIRSSKSAIKIINNLSVKPHEKETSTELPNSSVHIVQLRRTESVLDEAVESQHSKSDQPRADVSPKSQTISKGIDCRNLTPCKVNMVDLDLKSTQKVTNCLSDLSKKPLEISQSCSPGVATGSPKILQRKDNDQDQQENIKDEKIPENKLKVQKSVDKYSDSEPQNDEERKAKSQTINETELIDKLESIDLGLGDNEKDKQENLKVVQTNDDIVNVEDKFPAGIEKHVISDNAINKDSSCSRKETFDKGTEQGLLNTDNHREFSFSLQGNLKNLDIRDKKCNDQHNLLIEENKDNIEESKFFNSNEQNGNSQRTSDSNNSKLDSVEPSKPELSEIGSEMRRDDNELDGKDLEHKNIDVDDKENSCCLKNKQINDFHKRVLEKISIKTSLVRKVSNQSFEILKKKKNLNASGSSIELCIGDESMEVEENFDITTDTDAVTDPKLGSDTKSTNAYSTNDLKCKSEEKQECTNHFLGSENDLCGTDSSKEKDMDSINVLNDTEHEEVDMDKEEISEYTECEEISQVEGSDIGILNSRNNVGMLFTENIKLIGRNVDNTGSVFEVDCNDTINTKLQKFDDASAVLDDGGFGCLNTKNDFAVIECQFESDNTNNVESTVEIQNRNIFDAKNNANYVTNDNRDMIVNNGSSSVVELDKTDAIANADETESESVDIDANMNDKDNYIVFDACKAAAVDVGNDKVATFRDEYDSLDSALKQKYNIKDAFVYLDKVDHQEFESNSSVKESCEYTQPSNQANEEKNAEEDKGETEVDNNDDLPHHKPMDTQRVETDRDTAHSETDPMRGDSKEESSEGADDVGWRKVVPLSERFSQLTNKPEETVDGTEETEYKAEFENIVNKLKKVHEEVGLHGHTTSNTGQNEAMEVDELADYNEVDESNMTSVGNDEQNEYKSNGNDITSQGKVNEQNDNTNLGEVSKQTDILSVEDVMGKSDIEGVNKDVAEAKKNIAAFKKDMEHNPKSPVSFLDYSDESDDELLVTPSAFLRSIEEINGRPLVITPTSSQNSSITTSSNDLSPLKPVPQKPGLKNKFTLDGLLADHEERADLVKEMNDIDQELQDEIKQGGFVNILNKEDAAVPESPITDEQKEILRQFEVEESRICEDRPGVLVFEPQNYQCLFTSMLRPTDCGFTVGSNGLSLEKHLESLTPAQCKRVITSGIISQCFTKISCQTPIMRWLFFIMSIHDDNQVQQGCKKVLLEILHFQLMDCQQKWAPRLVDILSVLVNYGASLESLIPCNSSTLEIIRGKLVHQPEYIHQQPPPHNVGMHTENLLLVLQILAQCLHGPSGRYSPNDLSLLCVALCKASLDTSLKHLCAKGAFQNCVTMVIRQYLEADWLKERLKLTRMLVGITDHHHNNAHIAELLPPGARGQFIQRGFCFLVLCEILLDKTNVSDELLNSIKIKDLGKFVPKLKALLERDSYKLSSVVTLIDLCVGVNITLNTEEREQLKGLLEDVRRVRVRDNVSMLDRTRVKDMIVRMTSKWALDIQTMKGKQTKIFEYASPVKMHIEQVHELQSSGDEDEQSDSDNERPCKLQKLTSQINT